MLNKLFFGPVGFHNGVRISAAMNAGLLIIAIALVRTRLPPKGRSEGSLTKSLKAYFQEPPYVFTVAGYDIRFIYSHPVTQITTVRTMLTLSGLYFPFFFLQLNAVKNGINATLAFYVV